MPPLIGKRPIVGRRSPWLTLALVLSLTLSLLGWVAPSTADAAGEAATATTRTVTLKPSKASYTKKSSPKTKYYKKTTMLASKAAYATYLGFGAVKLKEGEVITKATLKVYVSGVNGKKKVGLRVHAVKGSWTASKLTYKTRPALGGKVSTTTPSAKAKQTVSISLDPAKATKYLTSGASFRVINTKAGSTVKIARTGSKAPKLVLTIKSLPTSPGLSVPATPSPSPTPTTPATKSPNPTSDKLVFAHYFPPYPISLDNKAPGSDYYTTHYLNPNGENGKYKAIGGILRDRPIPQNPVTGAADWRIENFKTEIRQAIEGGIDGFAVDILSLSGGNWDATLRLLDAAQAVSADFKIVLQPDMTATTGSATAKELAAKLASIASHKSVFRVDGKLVVSPFKGEAKTAAWWKDFNAIMKSNHGITVALLPVFLNSNLMSNYASVSYGFGEWGARNPLTVANAPNQAAKARSLGKKWMSAVAVQDIRPLGKSWEEAGNTETLRGSWNRAIKDDADFVMITTWNDYAETTAIAPSMLHGYAFLDISAYYAKRFKSGSAPSITKDVLYLTHRVQDYKLKPTSQTTLMTLRSGDKTAPRNTVEVLSFLTKPATVTVTVGSTKTTYSAPAGVSAKLIPLATGEVSVAAVREGAQIATTRTSRPVLSKVTTQDLAYYAATSARGLPRQS